MSPGTGFLAVHVPAPGFTARDRGVWEVHAGGRMLPVMGTWIVFLSPFLFLWDLLLLITFFAMYFQYLQNRNDIDLLDHCAKINII